ncbi:phage tail fiber protein [Agrobacterium sp. CG674]
MSDEAIINYSSDIIVKVRHNQEVSVELSSQGPQGPQGEKGDDGNITPELTLARDQAVGAARNADISRTEAAASAANALAFQNASFDNAKASAASAVESDNARNVALGVETRVRSLEASALVAVDEMDAIREDIEADRLLVDQAKTNTESARDQANLAFSNTNAARADVFDARDATQTARDIALGAVTAAEGVRDETADLRDEAAESARAAAQSALDAANFDPSSYPLKSNNGSDFTDPAAFRENIGAASALELVTKEDAEGGVSTEIVNWTAERVAQAIVALASAKVHGHTVSDIAGLQDLLDGILVDSVLTGTPVAPTAGLGDVSKTVANTEFVKNALDALIGAAPGTLDTLQEIADALGDDPNFAATVTQQLAGKADKVHAHVVADITDLAALLDAKATKVSPDFTGTPTGPNAPANANDNQLATTKHVKDALAAAGLAGENHGHAIADTAGLQQALDGKSAVDHKHVAADITDLAALLNAKATLASPTFTGTVSVPSPAVGDSSQKAANTSWVATALANALSGKANSAHNHTIADVTDLQSALNAKAALASPALTGTPTAPTAAEGTNNTQVATTGYADRGLAKKLSLAGGIMSGYPILGFDYAQLWFGQAATGTGWRMIKDTAEGSVGNLVFQWSNDRWNNSYNTTMFMAPGGTVTFNGQIQALGGLKSSAEIVATSPNNYRTVYGNYGQFWRFDGGNIYLMFTNSGDQYGGYSDLRPMYANSATGNVTFGHRVDVQGDFYAAKRVYVGAGGSFLETDGNIAFSGGQATLYGANLGYALGERLLKSGGSMTGHLTTRSVNCVTGQNDAGNNFEVRNESGDGDAAVAAMAFHCVGRYGIKMHLRPDGYFGLGGWSRPAWSWYSGPNGDMVAAGNVAAYSDPRLKDDVEVIENALDIVESLRGVRFTWNGKTTLIGKPGERDIGVLADEVEAVLPELVGRSIPDEDNDGTQWRTVAYDKLTPVIIQATKELRAEVQALRDEITALKGRAA